MPGSEFDIINRYFTAGKAVRPDVVLGIGDDGAVLRVPAGKELVVTTDTLVSGIHFAPDTYASAIGHKALAVNLSDLAAMGAAPAWATLSLTLPEADHDWLRSFSRGFLELADRFDVQLVGGDTCRGPLTITVQLQGLVEAGKYFRRDAARPGDLIYVTGTLGDAALALALKAQTRTLPHKDLEYLSQRLERPAPRIKEAQSLRGSAHAVIDVSDGLISDLGHILAASNVGAILYIDRIPLSPAFSSCKQWLGGTWPDLAVAGGDDYELCFTIDPGDCRRLEERARDTPFTCIGEITAGPGLRCIRGNGDEYVPQRSGYDHFRAG